jgi:hypothetical protein
MPSFVIDDEQTAIPESFSIHGDEVILEPNEVISYPPAAPRDHRGKTPGFSAARMARRASNVLNDDDYDYALELEADSEYR